MEALAVKPVHEAIRIGWFKDKILWSMSSPYEISIDEARDAQERAGYSIIPYGFIDFKCREENLGLYTATWKSYASAD